MDAFVIEGGKPLRGAVTIGGAKNAALPILAATLATDADIELANVPDLADVNTMQRLLRSLGCHTERTSGGMLISHGGDCSQVTAHYDLVRRMRAGICVLGPLLARRGAACVSLPGGCNIGHRPIDLHLRGLEALGADVQVIQGYVVARCSRLRGAKIDLMGPNGPTVTGTCNVLSAAVLARGTTVIENAALEPEVVDLANFLNSLGGRVHGHGTSTIVIDGVESLHGGSYRIIPDRIEAGTWLMAGALNGSRIELINAESGSKEAVSKVSPSPPLEIVAMQEQLYRGGEGRGEGPQFSPLTPTLSAASDSRRVENLPRGRGSDSIASHLTGVIDWLRLIGVAVEHNGDALHITACDGLRSVNYLATPYPGLPTDLQAQAMTLLCLANGTADVVDQVFPERFMHASELCRMGADIRRHAHGATVHGVRKLHGTNVMASDLRASAALVLAALAAEGTTIIRRIYHLDRGYTDLHGKLCALGASVMRISESPEIDAQPPSAAILDPLRGLRASA